MEVVTTIFPYTAWKTSFIHSAFENCAATISGVETAFRSLKKHGELPVERDKMNFIAFGGDGGTYDIGLQSLSGAMERGHNMLYVCYDNEAYMNTGIQRSSATPLGAHTSTAPGGQGQAGQGAEPQGSDQDHGGAQHPLRGPDHALPLEGPGHEGGEGAGRATVRRS